MKEFDTLLDVAKKLNDPETGCPWDTKQTFQSLQKYILEEACELIDAVDEDNDQDIIEELGDYLYVVIFYSKVAERLKRFELKDVIECVTEKLIRRHPHIFGDQKAESIKDVEKLWLAVKSKEKAHRKSALDGIPRSLLALARSQKILAKLIEHEFGEIQAVSPKNLSEDELGSSLVNLLLQAEADGLDAEKCLRGAINAYEKQFRSWESAKS